MIGGSGGVVFLVPFVVLFLNLCINLFFDVFVLCLCRVYLWVLFLEWKAKWS